MIERLVLHDALNDEWLVFAEPVDLMQARDPGDVLPVLIEVERRVNQEDLYAAGFVSYEAASGFDPAYVTHKDPRLPLVCFGLFSGVRRCEALERPEAGTERPALWQMTGSRDRYVETLSAIKRQIELGNTYQINYTVRKKAIDISDPWGLFLGTAADAPYAAYIECDDHAIVSASPELFFRLNGEQLISKPMKGTARRGLTSSDDLDARRRLYESQKNRAENVMIADMVRNDMGRIAVPGSVKVPRLFEIEKYPTVWQMTSTVSARTTAPVAEVFRALFPCASVTGAPKVSSMAIIAGLEDSPREIYTGAIGFMAPNRQARFSVAIRTAIVDTKTGEAVYGVGGGIVWDSDPDDEYRECLAKARILTTPACGQEFELLETMLWTPDDGYFLIAKHLNRMRASAGYFDFEFDQATIEKELAGIAKRLPRERHRIRLLLRRDGQIHSVEAPLLDADSDRPRRLVLAREPVDSSDPFLYHKTTRRDVYEQALRSAGEADDVLLWNEDGYVTETGIANVIVRLDGELVTPPVECGLLAGTYRELLLERGEVSEREIHLSELSGSTDLTLVNSVRGEYPARLSDTPLAYLQARDDRYQQDAVG